MTDSVVCDFDGGPFHDATLTVTPEESGDLPGVMVTDEGDYWVTYVLQDPGFWSGNRPRYRYMGEAYESEIRRCPQVKGEHVDVEEAS